LKDRAASIEGLVVDQSARDMLAAFVTTEEARI